MFNSLFLLLVPHAATPAVDLPTKKYLNLAAVKMMVAAAEAEARKRNVQVTICIVDESGDLLSWNGQTARNSTPSNSLKRRPGTRRFTRVPRRLAPRR